MSIDPATRTAVASRRQLLLNAGCRFGQLALLSLLMEEGFSTAAGAAKSSGPLRQGVPRARADSVIYLFMQGGPSHIDLFDPKPELKKQAGKPLPASVFRSRPVNQRPVVASVKEFKRHGKCGMPVSGLLPATAQHADKMCLIRSCVSESSNHVPAIQEMNTGAGRVGRPSLGAWSVYGLGSVNKDLPGYVVLNGTEEPAHHSESWGAGFLSPRFQASQFSPENPPLAHLDPPAGVSRREARMTLDLVQDLNRHYRVGREDIGDLDARASAYELAFRMQSTAHEVVELSGESAATRKLYGMDDPATEEFGKRCMVARRLVERGVRFVQVYCGYRDGWDAHHHLDEKYAEMCGRTDVPVAGLLSDLKSRGMLERTLVIWGGEFGRTPTSVSGTGRDHNPTGFSMWMAGGGVAGGRVIGATDDFGVWAVDEICHVNDLHATILHLIGLDANKLVVRAKGRDERPTVRGGRVISKALA